MLLVLSFFKASLASWILMVNSNLDKSLKFWIENYKHKVSPMSRYTSTIIPFDPKKLKQCHASQENNRHKSESIEVPRKRKQMLTTSAWLLHFIPTTVLLLYEHDWCIFFRPLCYSIPVFPPQNFVCGAYSRIRVSDSGHFFKPRVSGFSNIT